MRLPFQLLSLAAAILLPLGDASSSTRNPLRAISRVQNATIHSHNHRVTALSEFDLSFNLQDELWVKFHLEPNHDILGDDTQITYLKPDGTVSRKESINRLGHKVYKGSAWIRRSGTWEDEWQRAGWARIVVSKDGKSPRFEGAFSIGYDHHHIQSLTNYVRTRHQSDPEVQVLLGDDDYMVLWRDSDILPAAGQLTPQDLRRSVGDSHGVCQADTLSFNMQPEHPVYRAMSKRDASNGLLDFSHLFKRQVDNTTGGNAGGVNLVSTIGNTAGCPTTRKVALVGVATDCNYLKDFNSTETLRENVISQMNTASQLYESTFNFNLGLANLTVQEGDCPATPAAATEWNQACSDSYQIQDRLNSFSAWRGQQVDNNSHWTLLSTCNTGSAVGLAWLGQACVQGSVQTNGSTTGNGQASGQQTVDGANVVIRTQGASEWQIIAHETGHTFGAVHDCTSTTCAEPNVVNSQQCCPLSANTCNAGEQYIMNPSTAQGITQFSPCSIGNICSAMGRNSVKSTCLTDNRNVKTYTGQQCGNGIVEPGEECDCGGTEGCGNDTCCDPTTCKFTPGSVCDDSNEACCHDCQLASNGTVCRASTGSCDPQETCSGTSATCPADVTAPDGQSCGSGLQCASGQCTSRDQQCKTLMGSYTQGNDTYACDSSSCTISCASPEFGYGVCYGLQQNFLDGTVCGGGGKCANGVCRGASVGGQVKSWIDDHKELVIGIAASIGGLLVLSILMCLIRCCRRGRHGGRKILSPPPPMPPPGGWRGWQQPPQAQPQMEYYSSGGANGWGGSSVGGRGGSPVPPPAYAPRAPGGGVRYA